MRNRLSKSRGRRGGTVVEFALILPILSAMILGVLEFGHCFYVQHTLKGAAQVGARRGILRGATDDEIRAAVIGFSTVDLESGDVEIDNPWLPDDAEDATVQYVRVTVKGQGGIIGTPRDLSATAVMQKE